MQTVQDLALSRSRDLERPRAMTAPISVQERLAWYRERDRDAADLHRRYVRAKFRLHAWSEADLRRFHRYRRSVSREHAARLVIARHYAIVGLTAVAIAGLVAGLLYAAYRWWKGRVRTRTLPSAKAPKMAEGRP